MKQASAFIVGCVLGLAVGIVLQINVDELLWATWWWPEVRDVLLVVPIGAAPECPV